VLALARVNSTVMALSENIIRTFLLVTFVAAAAGLWGAKEWRGIVPLHSTRDDVRSILGKPAKTFDAFNVWDTFEVDGGPVTVVYSYAPCVSRIPGGDSGDNWNVPPNTVVLISVQFVHQVTLAQLDIPNIEKFKEETDDSGFTSYRNKTDGFFTRANRLGLIDGIIYGPQESDSALRCKINVPGSNIDPVRTRHNNSLDARLDSLFLN
jgi:hypothetical protein